jgi:hypothetical protein
MDYPVKSWVKLMPKAVCPECKRVFNLLDEEDAAEYYEGHDCEEE